jgi:hypothetical protein
MERAGMSAALFETRLFIFPATEKASTSWKAATARRTAVGRYLIVNKQAQRRKEKHSRRSAASGIIRHDVIPRSG